jgi:hypothetical protein
VRKRVGEFCCGEEEGRREREERERVSESCCCCGDAVSTDARRSRRSTRTVGMWRLSYVVGISTRS